jgi:hypothetical protein
MRKLCWIQVLLLMSCELVIDIDVPYRGDKIVLNAIQGSSDPWTMELTKTRYILDSLTSDFPPIADAEVVLFEPNGNSHRLNGAAGGYYWDGGFPQEGMTYRVVAKASGYNDIEAEMTVPKAVKIREVKWDSTKVRKVDPASPGYDRYYNFGNIPFTITLTDPVNEKNYYTVIVYYWYYYTRVDTDTQIERTDSLRGTARAWLTDPAVAKQEDFKSRFSDFAFNGTTYTVPLIAQFNFLNNSSVYRIDVTLNSISEEYFNYEESRELFNETDGDPFAQPVQIYTNVKNGLGIFAGFSTDQRSFDRKFP